MPEQAERQRPQIFDWLATAAVAALLVADYFSPAGEVAILRVVGTGMLVLSMFFFVPPFYLLKKHGQVDNGKHYFETNVLVDRGVYGIVRHPQYLGYCLLVLGFVLRSQRLLTALPGGVAVILFYLQAVKEERFCAMQLGAQYEDYSRKVPRCNLFSGVARYLGRRLTTGK